MTVTPCAYGEAMGEWRPWRDLRSRSSIEFMLCDLPSGVKAIYARRGEDEAILVSRALTPPERLAAVAHELVHAERGGSGHHPDAPASWAAVVAREEARVEFIVAERLLPLHRLADFVARRSEVEAITAELAGDLRHFVATILLDSGIAPTSVAGRLGHGGGGRTTQEVYAHFVPARDREAAELLARLIDAPGENVDIQGLLR